MRSGKKVQNTHISAQLRLLHMSMLEIFAVMNLPRRDEVLIREAGIPLDRALFPLLVHIERFGPIGVVDLAGRVGRDYTTVSRQVAKLESLDLIARRPGASDRRMHQAVIAPRGKAMTDAVDAARDRLGRAIFATWTADDLDNLVRLTGKLADALKPEPFGGSR